MARALLILTVATMLILACDDNHVPVDYGAIRIVIDLPSEGLWGDCTVLEAHAVTANSNPDGASIGFYHAYYGASTGVAADLERWRRFDGEIVVLDYVNPGTYHLILQVQHVPKNFFVERTNLPADTVVDEEGDTMLIDRWVDVTPEDSANLYYPIFAAYIRVAKDSVSVVRVEQEVLRNVATGPHLFDMGYESYRFFQWSGEITDR